MRILGIESSCDETAAAVVDHDGRHFHVRANVVYSQVKTHAKTGGIVPEVAAREHCVKIVPVLKRALVKASATTDTIDAIAVTAGPGLMTALSVGVEAARTLSWLWNKPLIPVNHIAAHAVSPLLMNPAPLQRGKKQWCGTHFPALALVVSGGHTELLLMKTPATFRCVGRTLDDAAGEAFDKVAKLLGLGYPGGPAIARAAEKGEPRAYALPRPMANAKNYDFSFSGIKTAVLYMTKGVPGKRPSRPVSVPDMAASFQQAVIDVLIAKTVRAANQYRCRSVFLAGGVAANKKLRHRMAITISELTNCSFHVPAFEYCTDNAAMIAAAGALQFQRWSPAALQPRPLPLRNSVGRNPAPSGSSGPVRGKKRWPWKTVSANPNWELWS